MKSNNFILNLSKELKVQLKVFCKKIEIAGSIRRKDPTPFDIDIVLIPKSEIHKQKIREFLTKKGKFIQGGEKRETFRIKGIKVELYFTTSESWGATLLAYSSEKGSAIGLRLIAKRKGLHLNQYGLFKGKKMLVGKTEKEIYKTLQRPYKRPENR